MFFPALLAKILSAGAVAQAATGATVVVVAFAGAGAAGVLPGPVQDTFTSIVSNETDEELPVEEAPVADEVTEEEAPLEDGSVEDQQVAEPTAQEIVDEWMTAAIDGSFGSWVSAARHDPELLAAIEETGHNFGHYVSQRAKQKGMTDEELAEEGVDLEELTEGEDGAVVEEAPEADAPEAEVAGTEQPAEDRGARGNGNSTEDNGGGRGNGNGRN